MATPKGFSMKRIVVGILVLAVIALVVIRVVQASAPVEPTLDVPEIRQESGIPVEVAQATVAPLEVRRSFTGTVRGIRSATVRARTGDQILEIPVRVGQRIAEGAVVVRQSSQGSQASVRQAEEAHGQARRTVERLRPLHEKGAISDQDWDNAQTALRVAEANLEAARKAIVLTSPIDGVVTDVMMTVGSYPEMGTPLARISDLSQIQVLLGVSGEQRRELAIGQEAYLPSGSAQGRITRIALQADPETHLMEVEVTFPGGPPTDRPGGGGDNELLPSTLAPVEVVVGSRAEALQIPTTAYQDGNVWVLDGEGRAHLLPVEAGLRGGGSVEVLQGLDEGQRVVTAGGTLLSEGALTRVVGG